MHERYIADKYVFRYEFIRIPYKSTEIGTYCLLPLVHCGIKTRRDYIFCRGKATGNA